MQNVCEISIPRYEEKMSWWGILSNPVDKISQKWPVRTILSTYIIETALLVEQEKQQSKNTNKNRKYYRTPNLNLIYYEEHQWGMRLIWPKYQPTANMTAKSVDTCCIVSADSWNCNSCKKTYLERCLNVIHGVNRQPNHLVSEFPILYRKWGSTAYSTAYILSIPNTDKKNNDFFHKIYCNDYRLQNNDNTHTENASKTSSVHEDVIQSSHYKSNNYFS